jgi:hypothetical protein
MSEPQRVLDPEAAAAIGKVRRMMIVIMTATFVAIALVLVVIGYRLFHVEESGPEFADVTAALPAGAKVLSTAVSNDHIVVTIEVGGVVEVRTYDPDTLQATGRLRFPAAAPGAR